MLMMISDDAVQLYSLVYLVSLMELLRDLLLSRAHQLQVEVREHRVEQLRQLRLVDVRGLRDPYLWTNLTFEDCRIEP